VSEELRYPGPGGVKTGVIARPASRGRGVVILGACDDGPAICDALAARGFVGAAPAAADALNVEAVASVIGFVAGSGATEGDKVALFVLPAGVALAVTLATEIAELIEGVLAVGPIGSDDKGRLRSFGVRVQVRPDINPAALTEASGSSGEEAWDAVVAGLTGVGC
jgi:hypothetical protein